jgi:hypothetical protein
MRQFRSVILRNGSAVVEYGGYPPKPFVIKILISKPKALKVLQRPIWESQRRSRVSEDIKKIY